MEQLDRIQKPFMDGILQEEVTVINKQAQNDHSFERIDILFSPEKMEVVAMGYNQWWMKYSNSLLM